MGERSGHPSSDGHAMTVDPIVTSRIRLAVVHEVAGIPLASLLRCQRAQEPETRIAVTEVPFGKLKSGIADGCYDAGLALATVEDTSITGQPLWRDDLVVVVPVRSPLLAYTHVPPGALADYPVIDWCPDACETLYRRVHQALKEVEANVTVVQHVRTFDVMAVLVSAGYGVGLCERSRIAGCARMLNIAMRPLVGGSRFLTTHLLFREAGPSSRINRLARRATGIAIP